MIWRRVVLLACPPLLIVVETYRRGYLAPCLFGVRLWRRAVWEHTRVYPETEPDPIG